MSGLIVVMDNYLFKTYSPRINLIFLQVHVKIMEARIKDKFMTAATLIPIVAIKSEKS